MGLFSFKTCDTELSIPHDGVVSPNLDKHPRAGATIYLLMPEGKPPIKSIGYSGYGDLYTKEGELDLYVWLGKMNPHVFDVALNELSDEEIREQAIKVSSKHPETLKVHIKLSYNESADYHRYAPSDFCDFQGHFYPTNEFGDFEFERKEMLYH